MKTIAVLTSGREVAGMNATIRAVVRRGIFSGIEVFGVRNGFEGLLSGDIISMKVGTVGDIIQRGGTILFSSLFEGFTTDSLLNQAIVRLTEYGVEGLVVIGDNGALFGAAQLSGKGFPVIGIPASAENDIPGTDYCIGFDSAINAAVDAIDKIRDTASSHERTYIVEVLGRKSADAALWAGMCVGAESIIFPECSSDMEDVIHRIEQGYSRGKTHSIVVVSEGFEYKNELRKAIQEKIGFEAKITMIGHLLRGGSPSAYDRMISSRMGAKSVDLLLEQKMGLFIGIRKSELTIVSFADQVRTCHSPDMHIYDLAKTLSI
jgi:6-phosphofructokinase 1